MRELAAVTSLPRILVEDIAMRVSITQYSGQEAKAVSGVADWRLLHTNPSAVNGVGSRQEMQ